MIRTKQDLQYYLKEDSKWYSRKPITWTERFKASERWIAWKIVKTCRKEEYHTNNMNGSLYHKIMRLYYSVKGRHLFLKYGVSIHPNSIGPGLYIAHIGNIMIAEKANIGKNFIVRPGCTIGYVRGENGLEAATIGDNVELSLGVKMFGPVKIGRGSIINANSVLIGSIPPYAVVCGNPAKVIGFRYTPKEIIAFEESNYPAEDRLPLEILEKNYQKYFIKRIKEIKEYTKL